MENEMFRYLEKYVGTYRVMAPYDEGTLKFPKASTFDDLYIPCVKGVIKHSYDKSILCWCCYDKPKTATSVIEKIRTKYPKVDIKVDDCSDDVIVYFNEADLKKIATIVKPKTSGASISPYSKRNLPKAENTLKSTPEGPSSKEIDELNKLFNDMEHMKKVQLLRKINNNFNEVINKKQGKDFNAKEEYKCSGLNYRQFVYSLNMWNDYVKFVGKELKNG